MDIHVQTVACMMKKEEIKVQVELECVPQPPPAKVPRGAGFLGADRGGRGARGARGRGGNIARGGRIARGGASNHYSSPAFPKEFPKRHLTLEESVRTMSHKTFQDDSENANKIPISGNRFGGRFATPDRLMDKKNPRFLDDGFHGRGTVNFPEPEHGWGSRQEESWIGREYSHKLSFESQPPIYIVSVSLYIHY